MKTKRIISLLIAGALITSSGVNTVLADDTINNLTSDIAAAEKNKEENQILSEDAASQTVEDDFEEETPIENQTEKEADNANDENKTDTDTDLNPEEESENDTVNLNLAENQSVELFGVQDRNGTVTYYSEDYQGDFENGYSFYDCWDNNVDGFETRTAGIQKVKDPINPDGDNYVMNIYSADSDGNSMIQGVRTGSRYKTTVYLYNDSNIKNITKLSSLSDDGIIVLRTKFLAKPEVFNYFRNGFYILPTTTRSSTDRYGGMTNEWEISIKKGKDNIIFAQNIMDKDKQIYLDYNSWHDIVYVFDIKTNTAKYYVNDTLVMTQKYNGNTYVPILQGGLKVFYPGNSEKTLLPEGLLFIDDTSIIGTSEKAEYLGGYYNQGDCLITLSFATTMDLEQLKKVQLFSEQEDVSEIIDNISLSDDGKTAFIQLNKTEIVPEKNYSLTIPGDVKDKFYTQLSENGIEDAVTFTIGRTTDIYNSDKKLSKLKINGELYNGTNLENVNSLSYAADIVNAAANKRNVLCIFAVYGENDEIIANVIKELEINGDSSAQVSFEIDDIDKAVLDVRMYVCDNTYTKARPAHEADCLTDTRPRTDAIPTKLLTDGGFSVLLSNKDKNIISVTSKLKSDETGKYKNIFVAVLGGKDTPLSEISEKLITFGEANIDSDGNIKYAFGLSSRESSDYTVYMITDDNYYKENFAYKSIADVAAFVRSISDGTIAKENCYKKSLEYGSLIGTDFEPAVKDDNDVDLFNRRVYENKDAYPDDSDERTVQNLNKVISDYVMEITYLHELEMISDNSEIYNKLVSGMGITGIQLGHYNTLILTQKNYVLNALKNKDFKDKDELVSFFNKTVAEALKFFPDKQAPDIVKIYENNFETDDLSNFKGTYAPYRNIDTALVKSVRDPINSDNKVMMVSGNSVVSEVDNKKYDLTALVLSEKIWSQEPTYADYGIDMNNDCVVWKADVYFDEKMVEEFKKSNIMTFQITREGGHDNYSLNWNMGFAKNNNTSARFYSAQLKPEEFDNANSLGNVVVDYNKWHSITQIYDGKNKKMSIYIDDLPFMIHQKTNATLASNNRAIGMQMFFRTAVPDNLIYIDNIETYAVKRRAGIEAYTYNQISGVVTIEFATPIYKSTLNKLVLKKGDEDVSDLIKNRTLDDSGYYAVVEIDKDNLELNSTYKFIISEDISDIYNQPISITPTEFEIKTGRTKSIYVDTDSENAMLSYNGATLAESDKISYLTIINNVTDSMQKAIAGMGIYGKNDKLLHFEYIPVNIPSGGGNVLFEANDIKNADNIRVYLWNTDDNGSLGTLVHSCVALQEYEKLVTDAVTTAVLPEFSVMISDIENNYISVAGNAGELSSDGLITIIVLDGADTPIAKATEKTVAAGSTTPDENSKFNYSFEFDKSSGNYTVYVITDKGTYKKNFSYKTLTDTAAMIKSIVTGMVASDKIYDVTKEYADIIGVDFRYTVKKQRDINIINNFVIKNKSQITATADIDYLKQYKSLLSTALREITFLTELENTYYYGAVIAKLKSYKDINKIDFNDFDTKLTDDQRAAVGADIIGKTFTDAEDVKTYFNSLVTEKKGQSQSSDKNTNNSKGSGGTNTNSTPTAHPTTDYATSRSFKDLENYQWALYAVTKLVEKNIVNGVAENEFAPAQNVKREQFVKMLVIAFGKTELNAECNFEDVTTSDWFYPYIASARKYNIVNGISESLFGAGYDISRQDMAVMIYNALVNNGYAFNKGQKEFADSPDISDYAKTAVEALAADGIINGVGDNRFEPHKNATRAEAAVMINNVLEIMQ